MPTLKQLVDETTNIKNDIVSCVNNLETNLVAKGVEVVPGSKMSNLIDKVKSIKEYNFPKWYVPSNLIFKCADLPEAVYSSAHITASSDKLYIAEYNKLKKMLIYDIHTNTYTIETNASETWSSGGIICVDDVLYSFSGIRGGSVQANCYKYNSLNKSWDRIANIGVARTSFGLCKKGNDVYIAGGRTAESYSTTNALELYNTVTDTFTRKEGLGSTGGYTKCDLVYNNIYVSSSDGPYFSFGKYNILTNTWTQITSYSHASSSTYPSATNGKVLIRLDKVSGTFADYQVSEFNDVTNTWTTRDGKLSNVGSSIVSNENGMAHLVDLDLNNHTYII